MRKGKSSGSSSSFAESAGERYVVDIGVQDKGKVQGVVRPGKTDAECLAELLQERQAAGSHALVEFYAPWCPHCQHFKPIYTQISKQVHDENLQGRVTLYTIDCTSPEGTKICKDHGVHSYPTIKHLDCSGKTEKVTAERSQQPFMEFIRGLPDCVPASKAASTEAGFSVESESSKREDGAPTEEESSKSTETPPAVESEESEPPKQQPSPVAEQQQQPQKSSWKAKQRPVLPKSAHARGAGGPGILESILPTSWFNNWFGSESATSEQGSDDSGGWMSNWFTNGET